MHTTGLVQGHQNNRDRSSPVKRIFGIWIQTPADYGLGISRSKNYIQIRPAINAGMGRNWPSAARRLRFGGVI